MKWRLIIFIILFLLIGGVSLAQSADDSALIEQIKAKEAEITKLETELNKYKDALSKTRNESSTLRGQIALIEAQINKLKADINITKIKISKTRSNIKLYSNQIGEKEQKIKERQAAISKSFRFLAYADNIGIMSILLMSEKLSDFLSQNEYIITVENGLYSNFKILSRDKKDLEGLLIGQKKLNADLGDLKEELQSKTQSIESQKQEKNALLKETKNQETEYQKIISQIQVKQAQIQKEISELESKLRGEVAGVPPMRPGELAWPLLGRITQGYGPTSITGFYNDAYKFHNGIDIALEYGAPVRASLDGVISASGDDGRYAYGKWLAIKHYDGLTTLYAHFSAKTVVVGERVNQGQIIGYEGSTGFITGPHLHFTVYSTNTFYVEKRWFGFLPLGGSVNPLDYLLKF